MNRPENCPSVTVLICTLNEGKNLPQVLPKIPRWVDEILLADGHSTDNAVEPGERIGDVLSEPLYITDEILLEAVKTVLKLEVRYGNLH